MAQPNNGWTDERFAAAKKAWLEGDSASDVARQLGGVSRNAVVGKMHREGLKRSESLHRVNSALYRHKPIGAAPIGKVAGGRVYPALDTQPLPTVRVELPGTATILTLESHMCKWPIGDPADDKFTFCGRARAGGPYCEGHARIAYQPQTAKAIKRDQRGLNRLAGRAA